jgi:hypothetical protein
MCEPSYKWCKYKNENVICYGVCDCCLLTTPSKIQQYNYKCPCGGEFMSPTCTIGTSVYNYKCPFCGKPMEGMNG